MSEPEPKRDLPERVDAGTVGPPSQPKYSSTWHLIVEDAVRTLAVVGLTATLILMVVLSFQHVTTWQETKDLLNIILPIVTGFIGTAIGYYFGTKRPG